MNNHKQALLALIVDGQYHSGETLSGKLGVSRAAINKTIHQLRQLGLDIESRHGRGYRLQHRVQLLEPAAIQHCLSAQARQQCSELEILFETESTNDYLAACLRQGPCSGKVVLAEYQSQGKGRRGHEWISPLASGLYLSMVWQTERSYGSLGLLSLFIGVAVARALSELGVSGIGLKWPNDILIDQKKLGGILVEMQGEANGPVDIIVGVGINYELPASAQQAIEQPVTDLSQHMSGTHSRNAVAAALISHVFSVLTASLDRQRDSLLNEWRQFDCYKDKTVNLVLPDSEITGKLKGVDNDGCLLISVDGQLERYTCGEISLRMRS